MHLAWLSLLHLKNHMHNSPEIPPQYTGTQSNTESAVTASNRALALKVYTQAKRRLLNVNAWEKFCGASGADFKLIDGQGREDEGLAKENDYFKINVPGPGNASGHGYDWVKIENIQDNSDAGAEEESITITVRPSSNPDSSRKEADHFFSEEATSTFTVSRLGNTVTAAVYGRNEKPNTTSENIIDKVRNAIVATAAIAAGSKIQWKLLADGLLAED